MTPLSETILKDFQVRKTKTQKQAFRDLLQAELNKLGLPSKLDLVGKRITSRNVIIGNLETSQVVLTAHYDTPSVIPFPNLVFPKSLLGNIAYGVALVLGLVILLGILRALVGNAIPLVILGQLPLLFSLGLLFWIVFGKANRNNANDNTSGVITLLEILKQLDLKESAVCAVLFDHEEVGLLGSLGHKKKYPKLSEHQLIVNFDCVADGDYLMLIESDEAKRQFTEKLRAAFQAVTEKQVIVTESKKTLYPSDQMHFPVHVGVMACHKKPPFGYYLSRIHTAKDTVFDQQNISTLTQGFVRFVQSI